MLLPPRPITRLIAFSGTDTFLDLNGEFNYFLTTSFQPSSLLPPCFGLVEDTIEFLPAHEPEFESPSQ
ncbi:hypothetical protein L798_04183 [Zootermopsis nevadensis]|uniref:Uncharacterized protein n=1 Tax=Zootermopsis nevadensis TaxID=136037 RepID=A0A067QHZ1_ZOONE|nr:hypothetical protein L798_04183 [Zootermopsis nevadensis]